MQLRFLIVLFINAFPRPDVQPFSCLGCLIGKGGADHVQAFIMGQVEMQRGYGDVIVSRGLQIGSVIRCMDSAAKRSEEHTSELQSLMRISYAVFCLNKKKR